MPFNPNQPRDKNGMWSGGGGGLGNVASATHARILAEADKAHRTADRLVGKGLRASYDRQSWHDAAAPYARRARQLERHAAKGTAFRAKDAIRRLGL